MAPVCFGQVNRPGHCPTPSRIAYVSRCEQVACAACVKNALAAVRAHIFGTCHGCGARVHSAKDVRQHWRRMAPAPTPGSRGEAEP